MSRKKIKFKNIISILFVVSIVLVLITFPYRLYMGPKKISDGENRMLSQMPSFSINKYSNRKFQDGFESYLSDQFIASGTLKNVYIKNKTLFTNIAINAYFENTNNIYLPAGNNFFYYKNKNAKKMLSRIPDEKMASFKGNVYLLNKAKAKALNNYIPHNIKKYYYLANLDDSYDFTQKKENTLAYDYMKKNLNGYETGLLWKGTYSEYEKYFYKSDHHWNHYGINKAYNDIMKMMDSTPLKPIEQLREGIVFYGISSMTIGSKDIYDDFSAYYYDFPDYYNIDGERIYRGMDKIYKNQDKINETSYVEYYGAENIIDSTIINPSAKGNCLLLGNSMSYGAFNFIASNFNKTIFISTYSLFNEETIGNSDDVPIYDQDKIVDYIESGDMNDIFKKMFTSLSEKMKEENIDTFLFIDSQTQPFVPFGSLERDEK